MIATAERIASWNSRTERAHATLLNIRREMEECHTFTGPAFHGLLVAEQEALFAAEALERRASLVVAS